MRMRGRGKRESQPNKRKRMGLPLNNHDVKKYKKREKLMCDIFRLILRKKMNIEYKQ